MMKRFTLASLLILGLACMGCSRFDGPALPGGQGHVSIRFVRDSSVGPALEGYGAPSALGAAGLIADSILVKVFRPGTGPILEASKGAAIPAASDTVELTLTVLAEANKRVAVELFDAGSLVYFGVDEDVDVTANTNTAVSIEASTFQVSGFSRDSTHVVAGKSFNLKWNRVAYAASYLVQGSVSPNFASIDFESEAVDTFLNLTLPQGAYYFRVNPQNIYTKGDFTPAQFVYSYSAPSITTVNPLQVMRGETLTIKGSSLNYPGTGVFLFGIKCSVQSSSPESLVVRVPLGSFPDNVEVDGPLGTSLSTDICRVQLIAYIMGTLGSGDLTTAIDYKTIIDAFGPTVANSAVKILPYTSIDLVDMRIFEVIIVGHDTGTNQNDWGGGVRSRVDAIHDSGAPALGIGLGGLAYFERAGLNTLRASSATSTVQRSVFVVNASDSLYKWPKSIPVPGDGILGVYTRDVIQLAVPANPLFPPPGVELYAERSKASTNYVFIDEDDTAGTATVANFLWGFMASPRDLNTAGVSLFENVVVDLFRKSLP